MVGIGLREGTALPEVTRLIRQVLAEAGLTSSSVARLATLTGKGDHPAVRRAATLLGVPVDEHPAEALAAVAVPNPSAAVVTAVGTTSVAEAAALASAPGGELVVPKQKTATVTVAVARAAVPGLPLAPAATTAPALAPPVVLPAAPPARPAEGDRT